MEESAIDTVDKPKTTRKLNTVCVVQKYKTLMLCAAQLTKIGQAIHQPQLEMALKTLSALTRQTQCYDINKAE